MKKGAKAGKIMDGHVYHLPKGKGYGKMGGHDVVVVKHFKKTSWSKVRSISSLEKETNSGVRWYERGLQRAKEGKLTPVPINEMRTRHWSGIDGRDKFVRDSDLERRHFTKRARIKKKYLG